MSNTPGIDALREDARRLLGLLDDPHPGLHTWMLALSRRCMSIADYAGKGNLSAFDDLLEACEAALKGLGAPVQHHLYQDAYAKLCAAIAKAKEGLT